MLRDCESLTASTLQEMSSLISEEARTFIRDSRPYIVNIEPRHLAM